MRVQTLHTNSRVKRLDKCVVSRLSWPVKVKTRLLPVGPLIQVARIELRTVANLDHRQLAIRPRQSIAHFNHVDEWNEPRTSVAIASRVLVDYRHHPIPSIVVQLISHEVHHPPPFISASCLDEVAACDVNFLL